MKHCMSYCLTRFFRKILRKSARRKAFLPAIIVQSQVTLKITPPAGEKIERATGLSGNVIVNFKLSPHAQVFESSVTSLVKSKSKQEKEEQEQEQEQKQKLQKVQEACKDLGAEVEESLGILKMSEDFC